MLVALFYTTKAKQHRKAEIISIFSVKTRKYFPRKNRTWRNHLHGGKTMALRINTNVSSLNAHKNMVKTDNQLTTSLERLASGLRINKAADDASGMSIADSLRSQGMGLGQAVKNANDGINIVQTADAALEESINIVNTIKTKAIQAAQDGQTTESRAAIQADIDKLMEELDIIAKTTSFNGQKLLSGQFTDKKFQIGAYSGETVNISIASSESTKIGHVTTGLFSLKDDEPGIVEIAIYSTLQDKNFQLQATEIAYSNSRENSMAAVADSINKLSDVLGISAQAIVKSTTSSTIGEGELGEFYINKVAMNGVKVAKNDTTGSLVKAINNKTSQHGVRATVDAAGYLTLTSTDGRAIEVKTDDEGLASVFKGDDLSTVGNILLTQAGSNDIVITNVDGGEVVSLTNKMDIRTSEEFSLPTTAAIGSKIAKNSIIGAGWKTSQDISTSASFTDDIVTTLDSSLTKGSTLGSGSVISFQGTIFGQVVISGDTGSSTVGGTTAAYSTLTSGSVLAKGSEIGTGITLGGESVIEETAATTADSTIKTGSNLAAGSVLASNTVLTASTVTIEQTKATVGSSFLASGSTLTAGTIIGKSTDLGNSRFIVEASEETTSSSTLANGSILKVGTVLGNGTTVNDETTIFQTGEVTANSTFPSGSTLAGHSLLKAGSYIPAGLTVVDVNGDSYGASGVYLSNDVVLKSATNGSGVVVTAGSTLANGTILGSGTTLHAEDITLAVENVLSGGNLDAKVGTSLAGGTILASGSQMGVEITLRSTATLSESITAAKDKSVLAAGTSLSSGSQVSADLTLKTGSTIGGDLIAETGSSFAEGSILKQGSLIHTDLTLKESSTLTTDMASIPKEIRLGAGTILGSGSILLEGSAFDGLLRLDGDVNLKKDQGVNADSTIETDTSFIKAGSEIGGFATAKQDMDVIMGEFVMGAGTKLALGSMLTNGSTIGGTITLDQDETVAAGTLMLLERGSILAHGSLITAGTYLTSDITADDGKVYPAGKTLESDITTAGINVLNDPLTLQEGSVIAAGSTIAANAGVNGAETVLTDSSTSRLSDVSVLTQDGAQIAIAVADATLKDLDKVRADLGSVQNQLNSTIANISTTRVNVLSAESTIRDVDFADESANFTKLQILAQAGTFAMSQANASSQNVLSLLQ